MPLINIKGVGQAQFPDDMPIADIRNFLRKKYSQQAIQGQSDILAPAPQTIEAYEPTLSERMGQGVSDALYNTGIVSDRYGAQRIGSNVATLGEFLPGIGDAAAGDGFGRALQKGNYGEAALAGAGNIPILGDMAIFAGALAKNADLGALRKAKMLEDTGADRNEIWKETGWFNDRGDWKFEIDDSRSVFDIKDEALAAKRVDLEFALAGDKQGAEKYNKSKALEADLINKYGPNYSDDWDKVPEAEQEKYFESLNEIPDSISDILWDIDGIKDGQISGRDIRPNSISSLKNALFHDDVYSSYPDVGNVELQHNTLGKIATEASYMPNRDKIIIGDPTYSKVKSPVLHELQHAIQQREGFAKGGSPKTFQAEKDSIASELNWQNKRIAELTSEAKRTNEYQVLENNLIDALESGDEALIDKYITEQTELVNSWPHLKRHKDKAWSLADKKAKLSDPHKSYQRLAGEAEARNVQTRMNMTPEERRAKPPWETLDVPESELIYRKGSGVNQSAENLPTGKARDTLKAKYPDLKIGISETKDNIILDKVIVPDKSKGTGTKFMNDLISDADSKGKTIGLTPSADFGGNKKRLNEFYKRFGFVPNKGKSKDFTISETMIRPPKQ